MAPNHAHVQDSINYTPYTIYTIASLHADSYSCSLAQDVYTHFQHFKETGPTSGPVPSPWGGIQTRYNVHYAILFLGLLTKANMNVKHHLEGSEHKCLAQQVNSCCSLDIILSWSIISRKGNKCWGSVCDLSREKGTIRPNRQFLV